MQASIRHNVKRAQARRPLGWLRVVLWGGALALLCLLIGNAASASATFVRGTTSAKDSTVSAHDDTLYPSSHGPLISLSPVISATKADTFAPGGDVNGNGKFDPGDTIQYTVIISNTGSADATGVTFTDTIDSNTALVGGSVTVSPVANDDTYPQTVIGNVSINSALIPFSVLTNDFAGLNPVATITSFSATSLNGGSVTVNADGTFTYNPPAGYTGPDSFTYTLSTANGSSVGTVNLTISGMVWFINNNASACVVAGCGRLSNPFSTLAAFQALNNGTGNNPAANDNIFVYESGTTYTGGIILLSGQKLFGQDSTSSLATLTGLTPPSGSASFPAMNTGGNASTIVNASGHGVALNSGNTLNGFTAGIASGIAITGTNFGTLTVADVIVNTTGQALNLTNGTLAATFSSVTSSGGTNNIALAKGAGVLAGTLTMSAGALSGAAGNAFDLNGGTATISYAGTIGNSAARSVNIINMTGGTTTFSGAVSGTGSGINLTTNTGATINFTGGGMNLSTGTNAAFTATGGGTVNVTGANNVLATTTGTALNVANTTIGASGLTFQSISAGTAGSGPTNGIVVNNTGNAGGLSVTGTGTTAGSGGTIQKTVQGAVFTSMSNLSLKNMNFTNADSGSGTGNNIDDPTFNNASQAAINMSGVTTVVFDNLSLTNPAGAGAGNGINGQNVSAFTLSNSTIDKFGTNVNQNDVRLFNLTGTCAFTNDTFSLASENTVDIRNNTGSLTLTVQGSPLGTAFTTFNDTQSSGTGAAHLAVTAVSNATINLTVKSSKFLKMKTVGVQTIARGTSTMNVDIVGGGVNANGNIFDPQGGLGRSVDLSAQDTAHLNFNINNNPKMYGKGGPTINVFGINSAVMQGRINNNPDIRAGGDGQAGSAIFLHPEDNSTGTFEVINNTISGVGNDSGIFALSHGDGGANHSATLDVTIHSITITIASTNPGGVPGIDTRAGSNAGDTIKTCVDVMNNAVTLGSGGSDVGWLTREGSSTAGDNLYLQGMVAGGSNSARAANTWNARGNTPIGSAFAFDAGGAAAYTAPPAGAPYNGVCRTPSNPTAMYQPDTNRQLEFARNNRTTQSVESTQIAVTGRNVHAPTDANVADVTIPDGKFTSDVMPSQPDNTPPQFPTSVPTVSINIGTLNPGKSVTIKFQVTINNPWTGGNTTTVSNQGTVSGSNFTNVLTDDPKTPAPNDPTVTQIFLPADMVVAKSHAGSFRQGDVGDTYLITVTNAGIGPTVGTVYVTDTIPSGLVATGFSGTGWTCSTFVTCNRNDALFIGSSYPALALTVTVANNAPALVTNTVTVGGGGEITLTNDIANDPTTIIQVADLTITKTHSADFTQGDVGDTYLITVTNSGPGPTAGALVTLTDTLPGGLTATALSGSGWSCTLGTLVCTRSDNLLNGSSYPVVNLTVDVAANASPLVTNTVTVAGGGELVTNNDTANDPTVINQKPDLTVTKAHVDPFRQGDVGDVYTVTVRNNGLAATSGTVFVTDTLPSGLTATGIGGSGWSCVVLTLTCSRSDVLGASSNYPVILLTVTVGLNAPAVVTNTVTVGGGGELITNNDTANDVTNISQAADLSIAKTHNDPFKQGDVGDVYTITVSNVGFAATVGTVTVTDTLPSGLTATSIAGPTWACTLATLTCTIGSALLAGNSYPAITITVNVALNTAPVVTNTATVTGGADVNPSNNTAYDLTNIQGADLVVAKFHADPFKQGDVGDVYTITVSNTGTSTTTATVYVTDTLPASLTATGWGGSGWTCVLLTLTCQRSDALGPGGSYPVITLTVNVASNAPVLVTNTVTVAGGGEANLNNDTANDPTNILALVDLQVSKTGPATVVAGANLTYTIVVTNAGPGDAQNVVLTDTLPAGTSFVSQSQLNGPAFSLSNNGNAITDTISTLTAGATAAFQVVVTVNANVPNGAVLNNSAGVTSGSAEQNPADNTSSASTTVQTQADLQLSKSAAATVLAGAQLTYTLFVTNAGPSDAQNVVLTDTLPAGTVYVSQIQTNGPAFTLSHLGNTITDTISTLAAGATATFQVVVQVGANVADGTLVTNLAATSGSTAGGGASASATTTVTRQVDLHVTKTGSIDPVVAGSGSSNLTYVVTVTNSGPSDASGVSLSEVVTLPGGVSINSITPSSGGYAPPNGANGAWTVGSLPNGSSATLTIVLTVGPSTASGSNVISDTATVSATNETRINTDDDSATLATSVTTQADLQLSKTGATTVIAGTQLTYTIVVSNAGPSDAQSVVLSDTLPAGTTFVSQQQTNGPAFSQSNVGNAITDTIAALAAGGTATFQVVVHVNSNVPNSSVLANTAGIAATTADPAPGNNSATVNTTVQAQADLQVSKSGPATVVAGTQMTYTIVVTNAGPSDAQNVVLTDTLPAGTSFVSQQQTSGPAFTASNVGNAITDTLASMAAGASATFQVVVQVSVNVPNNTNLSNTATVSSSTPDSTPANDSSTVNTSVQAQADLQVSKSAAATVVAGTQLTYTITVTNSGPSDAQNVVLTDTLPGGTSFVSQIQLSGPAFTQSQSGNRITDTISTLAAGASATFQVVVQANANDANGSILSNTAGITSTTADPVPGNNRATANTTVQTQADVQLSKSAAATVTAGTQMTYTLVVTNAGPSDAQNVVLTDTLPAGTSFVSQQQTAGPAFTLANAGNAITDTIATLASGASATFQVVAQVGSNVPSGSLLSNAARVSSTTSDPNAGNNSAGTSTTVQTLADLQVSKSATSPVLAGAGITYTIIVTNAGPSDAQSVVLSDTLPSGTTFSSQQQTSGPAFTLSNAGNLINDTIATLAAGAVARFTVGASVSIAVPDLTVITNTATISSTTTDPAGGNNSASITSTVRAGADLSVVKSGPASVTAGTSLTYTLVVRNGGPLGADTVMTDVLPLSITFQSVVSTSTAAGAPSCQTPPVGQNGTLVCAQTLAAGNVTTYTIVTNVPANVPAGTLLTNTATVRSPTTPDVVPGNNTSTVQTQVTATADLQIVKRANTGTAFAGDLITYTIVMTNIGPSFAANVVLTDVLPLNATFRSLSSPGGWSCNTPAVGANGTVTCTNPSLGLGAVTFVLVVKVNYGNGLINTHVVNTATVSSDTADPTTPDVTSADVLINGAAVLKLYLPLILNQMRPGLSQ